MKSIVITAAILVLTLSTSVKAEPPPEILKHCADAFAKATDRLQGRNWPEFFADCKRDPERQLPSADLFEIYRRYERLLQEQLTRGLPRGLPAGLTTVCFQVSSQGALHVTGANGPAAQIIGAHLSQIRVQPEPKKTEFFTCQNFVIR